MLACSPVEIKPKAMSSSRVMLRMIETGCLVVDTMRCSETPFPNATTRLLCLLKTGSTVKFSHRNIWGFDSRNSSGHSTNECSSPDVSDPLLRSTGFSGKFQILPPIFLTLLDTVNSETFFFCASLVIFWHGSFSNAHLMYFFLAYNLMSSWSRTIFSDSEAFKHCSTQ